MACDVDPWERSGVFHHRFPVCLLHRTSVEILGPMLRYTGKEFWYTFLLGIRHATTCTKVGKLSLKTPSSTRSEGLARCHATRFTVHFTMPQAQALRFTV